MPEMLTERLQADDGFWPAADDWRTAYRPYVVRDGILQVPVKGVLLSDFSFTLGGWATGYTYIWRAFQRGMADSSVRGIALICDSPGGHAAECFDVFDRMLAMRGTKPIRAFAHESAYSGAYVLASVADQIVVSRTGGVGSVGVVLMHLDVSGAMDQAGLKVTFVYAGAHKVDGNPYQALPDDVRARFQAGVDETYSIFVSSIAAARGMSEQAVRQTEALCFTASEALDNGFADAIGSLDDALADFTTDLNPPGDGDGMPTLARPTTRGITMTTESIKAAARAEERQRLSAILGHAEAKDRQDLARHLAMETDLSVEAAGFVLATAGKQVATTGSRFDAAMAAAGNPVVGHDAAGATNPGDADDPGIAFAERYFTSKREAERASRERHGAR